MPERIEREKARFNPVILNANEKYHHELTVFST